MTTAETTKPARVRFAPSPTGYLHLGGLRTALFDWLYARHTDGQFILRIEDTDQKRYNPESLDDLMRGLRWLGLDWDEGPDIGGPYAPYIQSERKEIYAQYIDPLIESGHAYRCYCTPERLEAVREEQRQRNQPPGYDRHCRHLSPAEREALAAQNLPSVVRLAVPETGSTTFTDLIRGEISTDNRQLQDAVLVKSDGMPTYHFAVVVDDYLMKITHVLRGQEWLASAPLHKLLFDAFGWEAPVLVHLPIILDPSGKGKMSKRKVIVAGKEYLALVHEFMEAGYLPDALFNFLTNVGWSYDAEQEVFSREEAIDRFDLNDINPSPAALPYDKLDWLNGLYIRALTPAALKEAVIPFLGGAFNRTAAELRADQRLDHLIPLIQERIKRLDEAPQWLDWAFVDADAIRYDDLNLLLGKKLDADTSAQVLERGVDVLQTADPFTAAALQDSFRQLAEEMGIKAGSFFGPFRGALTGKQVSPPLFESMEALGREEVLRRMNNAIRILRQEVAASV
ncbi:MAG: glutamate--tRNA ligase [Caldilineaceae bacterium]|nr:glutamate--tRNA ligase [Caldilineaceae bacterium]